MSVFQTLTRDQIRDLLTRMQGTGYTSAADSARIAELDSIAEIAAKSMEATALCSRNMFGSTCVEIATDMEWMLQIPTDDGLTTAGRQARLLAFTRCLPEPTPERMGAAFGSYVSGGTNPTTYYGTDAVNFRTNPRAQMRLGLSVSGASEKQTEALSLMMERATTATAAHDSKAGAGRLEYGATFTSDDDARSVLAGSSMTPTRVPHLTAPVQVSQGSALTPRELNEIRRSLFWAPRGGFDKTQFVVKNSSTTTTMRAGTWLLVTGSITSAAVATIDTGDWSNQLIEAWGYVNASDIRPGSAGQDVTLSSSSGTCWKAPSRNSAPLTASGGSTGVSFYGDAAGLYMTNTSGGFRYVVAIIRSSAKWVVGGDSETAAEAVSTPLAFPRRDAEYLLRQSNFRDPNATTSWTRTQFFSGNMAGGVRRVLYTGPTLYQSGSDYVPNTVTLDTSVDWRGRYLIVQPLVAQNASRIVTIANDGVPGRVAADFNDAACVMFYTGPGGGLASFRAEIADNDTHFTYALYADATTGHLICEQRTAGAIGTFDTLTAAGLFLVIASPRAADVATQTPIDTTVVTPADLNQPQELGIYQQGWGTKPRAVFGDPAQVMPTNPPLGVINDGEMPPIPLEWSVRERCGYAEDTRAIIRQRIFGQRQRMVSIPLAASETVRMEMAQGEAGDPIDEVDWRDRFIRFAGIVTTGDTSLANAPAAADNGFPKFQCCFYSGPFGTQTFLLGNNVSLQFDFRKSTSGRGVHAEILFINGTASARTVTGLLEATGQLGLSTLRTYL